MPRTDPAAECRTPSPWWVRLGGWMLALVVLSALVVGVVNRGTYGSTEHTVASAPAAPLTGEPGPTLTEQGSYPADSFLAGPVIARITEHGVAATDLYSGEELWGYARSDSTVCAHRVNAQHVTLIFASGARCDEAVSLDPTSGARQWQRTIEAVHPNRIIWSDGAFISLDPAKTIVYEDTQGFERFTLDNSTTDHIEGEHTSCENLDAAGSVQVATLQRCRATAEEPWLYQVVVNEPSDGGPRETGRSYLTSMVGPVVDGAAPDGTTVLRDATGAVYALPLGAIDPFPISAIPPVPPGEPLHVVAVRGSVLISTATTSYALDPSRTGVAWSRAVIAAPYGVGVRLYLATATGLDERDAVDGRLIRTIGWGGPVVAGGDLVVAGPLVGLRDAAGLRVYS